MLAERCIQRPFRHRGEFSGRARRIRSRTEDLYLPLRTEADFEEWRQSAAYHAAQICAVRHRSEPSGSRFSFNTRL